MSFMHQEQLMHQIEREFADDGMPDEVIQQLKAVHSPCYEEDERYCRGLISQSWNTLPESVFTLMYQPFSILPKDGWEYFLPAFMVAVLDGSMAGDCLLSFINTLLPIQPRGQPMCLNIRLDRFTPGRLKCTVDFLIWIRNNCFAEDSKVNRRIDRFLQESENV